VYWGQMTQLRASFTKQALPWPVKWALGLIGASIFGFLMLVYVFPRQLGSNKLENLGEYNPINDVTGWNQFTNAFKLVVKNDIENGTMKPNAPIVIHKWFPGGHILFYTARPLNKRVIAIGALEDVHKFAWLNETQPGLKIGDDAYCIVPSNLPANPKELYGVYFENINLTDTIPFRTNGVLLRNFYVYRLKHCKQLPPVILPIPSK